MSRGASQAAGKTVPRGADYSRGKITSSQQLSRDVRSGGLAIGARDGNHMHTLRRLPLNEGCCLARDRTSIGVHPLRQPINLGYRYIQSLVIQRFLHENCTCAVFDGL